MAKRLASRPASPLVEHWPRLTRFYGVSPEELQSWSRWLTSLYVEYIPILEKEEMATALAVSDFPHLEEKDREKIHYSVFGDTSEPVDATSAAGKKSLGDIGIAVVSG